MRVASTINATSISHKGHVYEPDGGGVFDVPDDVAAELLTWPHYVPEYQAVETAAVEQARTDLDPAQLHRRVTDLENKQRDNAALKKKLAELEKRLGDLEAAVAD